MDSHSERARKINELNDRIHKAFKLRDRSAADRDRWSEAVRDFHHRYSALAFTACYDLDGGLRVHAPSAVDASIVFLVADPYYFRSGYTKEYIWRHLPSCTLDSDQLEKIEGIAIRYLERNAGREFWYMCKALCHLARKSFWDRVETETNSSDPDRSQRALLLFEYRNGVPRRSKASSTVSE